jgi:hypothetical protein
MIVCPHCERALGVEHDEAGCRRKMSRRFFFRLIGGTAAALATAAPVVLRPGNYIGVTLEGYRRRTLPNRHARKRLRRQLEAQQRAVIIRAFQQQVYIADQMDVYDTPIYDTVTLASGDFTRLPDVEQQSRRNVRNGFPLLYKPSAFHVPSAMPSKTRNRQQ